MMTYFDNMFRTRFLNIDRNTTKIHKPADSFSGTDMDFSTRAFHKDAVIRLQFIPVLPKTLQTSLAGQGHWFALYRHVFVCIP